MSHCPLCDALVQSADDILCSKCWEGVLKHCYCWRRIEPWLWANVRTLLGAIYSEEELAEFIRETVYDMKERRRVYRLDFSPLTGSIEEVKQANAQWRERADEAKAVAHRIDEMPATAAFLVLVVLIVVLRRLSRRDLRQIFRYDARRQCFLRSAIVPPPSRFLPIFIAILQEHTLYECAFRACLLATREGIAEGQDRDGIMAKAVQAIQQMLDDLPLFVAPFMELAEPSSQAWATISMAGWAATVISLGKNRRLQQALSDTEQSPHTTLFERLPAHVYLAWREVGPAVSRQDLRDKIAASLAQDGPASISKSSRRAVPPESLSVEEMWLMEEARRTVDRVVSELPPRQAAIWSLARQGVPYAEIAARLGGAEGTVKSTVDRVKKKLCKATNA